MCIRMCTSIRLLYDTLACHVGYRSRDLVGITIKYTYKVPAAVSWTCPDFAVTENLPTKFAKVLSKTSVLQKWGPKNRNVRISHSGSEAQDRGDSRNHNF